MDSFWGNFIIEIGLFTFLGVLYYFYQKRKIIKFEENKGPMVMGYILHACLAERGESPHAELDAIIEAIDEYLHNRTPHPPTALLKHFASSEKCSPELKAVIEQAFLELA
ncbi:MAG TPA: hypothetical protein VNJ08_15760 [Bacteriovoracaceae bacterium]|nr:hypothetical protein [Bacteriovoracaceae bacterium]